MIIDIAKEDYITLIENAFIKLGCFETNASKPFDEVVIPYSSCLFFLQILLKEKYVCSPISIFFSALWEFHVHFELNVHLGVEVVLSFKSKT